MQYDCPKLIVRMTCINWKFFWRRNPNRPYQVDQLFDRQTMLPSEGTSSRKKYQNRKHKKRRQFDGLQPRALLPPWEKYSTKTQKYLAIGGVKGENYLIISSVLLKPNNSDFSLITSIHKFLHLFLIA